MPNSESHLCAICAAEFGSSKDLVQHERAHHSQHAAASRDDNRSETRLPDTSRQNHEFTRRNIE